MLNYADGFSFGWEFILAIIVTVGAFWFVLRLTRKHESSLSAHATKRPTPPRPQQRRPPSGVPPTK